ncbi:hypothetical protein DFJ69_5871 [Thermomonospora umbrina]|uniref:Uncharacterized protein n=2 Tax=Thermomonospora umbrina TaxID=111806 RepID=A0A3D9SWX7_9ACTN|nr:hypothetical protein DFJ69_5871 [Thermomonospora umbrina]
MSLLIAYFLVRNTTQDLVFRATGKMPPSYRRSEARRQAREERAARRREKGDGPLKRFFAGELEQAVADAGEKRERARAKKRAARREAWELEDAEEAARRENRARPTPQVEPPPAPTGNSSGDDGVIIPCGDCGAGMDPADVAGYTPTADPLCRACRTRPTAPPPVPQPSPASRPAPSPDPQHAAAPNVPAPVGDPDTTRPEPAPAAVVIDISKWRPRAAMPEPIKEADVSVSGETPNLSAALAYTNTMASECMQGAASVETSIASLQAGGVSGPALSALAQAQEALTQAMTAFNAANAALTRHVSVSDAYAANHDAGDKQFVTQD